MRAVAHSQIKNSYFPPFFNNFNRLEKMQTVFPAINKMYEEYARENHFPGYAFGIMLDGHLIYSGNGGYIDIKKKIFANSRSMFRIASITKSFTAIAILQLRDEGKLRLDDPIYVYIPEIKNQKLTNDAPEITIRDLLTHSAGFPEDNPWGDRNLDITEKDLIKLLKDGVSFSNVPGVTYEYSNLTFAILGLIIQRVSGFSYQNYISTYIWNPLNMTQVAWEFAKVTTTQLALGYKWDNDGWKEEDLLHDGSFAAMGGMITSIEAFSHYVALYQSAWPPRDDPESGPLKRSSVREMQQPWRFIELNISTQLDGQKCAITSAYGYGLKWLKDCDGRVYVGHSGGLPGFGSNWLIMPGYGIGVILFANVKYAPTEKINIQVLNTILRETQLKTRQLPPSRILNDRQSQLVKLMPDWKEAETSGIFAKNFFQDFSLEVLKKETMGFFAKAGKIIHISKVIPENQLRGYFVMRGGKSDLKISFTLTPQNPSLIQKFQIEEIKKENHENIKTNQSP